MVVHQLRHVFVARGDQHRPLLLCRHNRQCSDNIVRLYTCNRYQREPHSTDNIVYRLDLLAKLLWHGRQIGFVLRVNLVSEGGAFRVKNNNQLIGRIIRLQAL